MTEFQMLLRAIEARGAAAAKAAGARAADALLVAAIAELPDVVVTRDGDDILLTAPGLHARAFGSRRAAPDPRLVGLAKGLVR